MELGSAVHYAGNVLEMAERVRTWEAIGLDVVWVAEAYGYDAPTMMGYLAARTERVQIGSAILPLYSRTPALLAQTAAGLDHISGGRAILGLGASGPQVIEGWHAVPYDKPLARTREIIDICRRVWRREPLVNDGVYPIPLPAGQGTGLGKPLKLINHPVRSSIPVYIASLGEKNVSLTAEIADGWLPLFFSPKSDGFYREALGEGFGRPGARHKPEDFEVAASVPVIIDDDVEAAADQIRPTLALYIGGMGAKKTNFHLDVFVRMGYEQACATIQEHFLAGRKADAVAAVPTSLVEDVALVGPVAKIRDELGAWSETVLTTLLIQGTRGDDRQLLRTMADLVH
ncbi:MAG: hypothetical protein QOC75_2730 [Pseudonocardiales bacterium]|nr:hypothetical protein [Pseudonocardiales bacterium]